MGGRQRRGKPQGDEESSSKLRPLIPVGLVLALGFVGSSPLDQSDPLEGVDPEELRRVEEKHEKLVSELAEFGVTGPALRYDNPGAAADREVAKRAPDGVTPPSPQQYVDALEAIEGMPVFSSATGGYVTGAGESKDGAELQGNLAAALETWNHIGPGNVGGRVRGLVIHPTQPNTIWAAGVSGGIFKTTNGGASWAPLNDFLPTLSVSTLVLDPANPNVLYAGTGEGVMGSGSALTGQGPIRGAGVFKSTNGGASWTQLASTANPEFYYVNDIEVSPNNSSRIYAATRTGLWRSLNGGSSWTKVLNDASPWGCLEVKIRTDVATDWMIAACGRTESAGGSVYRNTAAEGAGPWALEFGSSEGGNIADMGRTSLAIAPSDQNYMYALIYDRDSSGSPGMVGVARSTDGGNNWAFRSETAVETNKLDQVLLSNPREAFRPECSGQSLIWANQGWYDNVIAVDPTNRDVVWAGGIDLFRSNNGGADWGMASYWQSNSSAHADQHAIVFHPAYNGTNNTTMFVGNDGGVYRTDNATAAVATGPTAPCNSANTSVSWTSLNNGLGITQFYDGTVYPSGSTYFGGTQDNGTVRGSNSGGINGWSEILGGDGGYVAVDPTNTNVLYAESQYANFRKSTNGGAPGSWVVAQSGLSDDFEFITPFEMDPNNSSRLWIGGTRLWRTTNGAGSWTAASTNLTGGPVTAIGISPHNGHHVMAGTEDGWISRSTTALSTTGSTVWSSVQPRSGWVSSLVYDSSNSQTVYATYSTLGGNHVWKSTNGGASWTGIDGSGATGLPNLSVHSIVVDPDDANRLYVGTDLGVFVTLDGGNNWATENTGFANVITEKLEMWESGGTRRLYAFTHGRGAFRVNIATETVANDAFANAVSVGSLPYSDQVGTTTATTQTGENLSPAMCNLGNASMGHTVWYRFTSPNSGLQITSSTMGSDYDTVLAVWKGTSLGNLVGVKCNDDISSTNRSSRVAFNVAAGTTYYFQVGGWGALSGNLDFSLSGVQRPKCRGKFATIWGTGGADTLVGTAGRDIIVGKGGADTIRGRGGNDLICAGRGNDDVQGQGGADKIWAGTGRDLVTGGPGKDVIRGEDGHDRLLGGDAADTILGGSGNDLIKGEKGNDTLRGYGGADNIFGGQGTDTCSGGPGADTISGCEH